ncbi:MAG: metalloregulator ArsR/SmtB family transcription factor [Victivallaceae bacterium]|nr:metalloregulator ArsR/SmtB family transcription factor [Victivallaceae bacterium]
MKKVLNITKALADESRVRALMLLKNGELCVCQIIEVLRLAPSTVSKHMSILKQADLVEARKSGRWVYYRLPEKDSDEAVRTILEWLKTNLTDGKTIKKDIKNLDKILNMDKEELCRKTTQS